MMIRVVNLVQHYSIRPVLKGITMEILGGELIAVMGPNGMGKSTLLGVMAGILPPFKGYVEINGKVRRSSPEAELAIRKQVFYLPDHPWLPIRRTGREYLVNVARIYEVDEAVMFDHLERLLELFELKSLADTSISSYSNGQRKKVAVCAALIADAPILLLDEPFSGGLDPTALLALRMVLLRLAENKNATIVMATPVPEIVEGLANRVAVIREGELVAFETPAELKQRAGDVQTLQEALEKLVNPQSLAHLERYFDRSTAG